ncbi:MAG TPA: hypothetical protein VK850_04495 [Candidatus Binatia bacterium]|nr:hypothetical protein [Candidatus Binatia bacterium]
MIVAMLNGFETILILMVVAVIFMASLGFQFDLIPRAGKKAFFYFLMTWARWRSAVCWH